MAGKYSGRYSYRYSAGRQAVLKDIILESMYRDSTKLPVIVFKPRSNKFRFDLFKDMRFKKKVQHPMVYERLEKEDRVLYSGDAIIGMRPGSIQSMKFVHDSSGYVSKIILEIKKGINDVITEEIVLEDSK